jgi:hypothetical protein
MDFTHKISRAAYREGERWCFAVYERWAERGQVPPGEWPLTVEDAAAVLNLPQGFNADIAACLAVLVDACARLAWAQLQLGSASTANEGAPMRA